MNFYRDLIERAAKTFVQAFVATFSMTFVMPSDFTDMNAWKAAAVSAAVAAASAALSALFSFISKNIGDKGTASLITSAPSADIEAPTTPTSPFIDGK